MIDPREVFLARAAARDQLFLSGDMTLHEAFDGLVVPFLDIIGQCDCALDIQRRLERPLPKRKRAA